jgi:hypothetical protein
MGWAVSFPAGPALRARDEGPARHRPPSSGSGNGLAAIELTVGEAAGLPVAASSLMSLIPLKNEREPLAAVGRGHQGGVDRVEVVRRRGPEHQAVIGPVVLRAARVEGGCGGQSDHRVVRAEAGARVVQVPEPAEEGDVRRPQVGDAAESTGDPGGLVREHRARIGPGAQVGRGPDLDVPVPDGARRVAGGEQVVRPALPRHRRIVHENVRGWTLCCPSVRSGAGRDR